MLDVVIASVAVAISVHIKPLEMLDTVIASEVVAISVHCRLWEGA